MLSLLSQSLIIDTSSRGLILALLIITRLLQSNSRLYLFHFPYPLSPFVSLTHPFLAPTLQQNKSHPSAYSALPPVPASSARAVTIPPVQSFPYPISSPAVAPSVPLPVLQPPVPALRVSFATEPLPALQLLPNLFQLFQLWSNLFQFLPNLLRKLPLLLPCTAPDSALNAIRAQLARIETKLVPSDSDLPPYDSPFNHFHYDPDPNPKRLAPCTVPIFKRGGGYPFDSFLYTMEIHFIGSSTPALLRVPILISRVDPSHHAELQALQNLPYAEFVPRIRRVFREPNLSHASLFELSAASQEKDESFIAFRERLHTLARRAFPTADTTIIEYTVASHFLRGLTDRKLARLLLLVAWTAMLSCSTPLRSLPACALAVPTALKKATPRAISSISSILPIHLQHPPALTDHLTLLLVILANIPLYPLRATLNYSAPLLLKALIAAIAARNASLTAGAPHRAIVRVLTARKWVTGVLIVLAASATPLELPAMTLADAAELSAIGLTSVRKSSKRDEDRCDLCGGPHYIRVCPRKSEAARLIRASHTQTQSGADHSSSSRREHSSRPTPASTSSTTQTPALPLQAAVSRLSFANPAAFPLLSLGAASGVPILLSSASNRSLSPFDRDAERSRLFTAAAKWFGPKLSSLTSPRGVPMSSRHARAASRGNMVMSGSADFDWDVSTDPAQGLFFVQIFFQRSWVLALADSGSSRNLMSHQRYDSLRVRPRLTPPRGLKVIGGNGQPISLLGFADFAVKVADLWIWHGFGVVDDLPLDVILGAEILKPHGAMLSYQPRGDNTLTLTLSACRVCTRYFRCNVSRERSAIALLRAQLSSYTHANFCTTRSAF